MSDIFSSTGQLMQRLSATTDAALVAFSGGKDSLVVMDLARRAFKRVVGVFYYFVPDLRIDAEALAQADKWGIEVLQYPHSHFIECLQTGVYCFSTEETRAIPSLTMMDILNAARNESGIHTILTGMKRSDNLARRTLVKQLFSSPGIYHPLMKWMNFDVLAYMQINQIPLPPNTIKGKRSNGVDCNRKILCYIYENYPDDWEKLCVWFPFAEAVIWRERWFYGYTPGSVVGA